MDRRDFLANIGLAAAWAGISITITSCGDDKSSNPNSTADPCAENGAVSVSAGHSHQVCIRESQLTAGNGVNLALTGSGHTHNLTLTAEQVAAIAAQTQVTVVSSSSGGHTHNVTFN